MKYFDWNRDKNEQLKIEREISFEEVVLAISESKVLDILEHHNKQKYSKQKIFVVEMDQYVYLIPFVEDKEKIFLKTIIPSRKATKIYLIKKKN